MPINKNSLFITGTGTEVGKTIVTAAYCLGMIELGRELRYWKPVQTGDLTDSDTRTIDKLVPGINVVPVGFSYPDPLSPDQAAEKSGKPSPDLQGILQKWRAIEGKHELVLEGAGGLVVPFNQASETWADMIQVTGVECLIVAHSTLGTINHTSLTIEGIRSRGGKIRAVVLNGPSHPENEKSLRRLFPKIKFVTFPEVDLDDSSLLNSIP